MGDPEPRPATPRAGADPPDWPDWLREGLRGRRRGPTGEWSDEGDQATEDSARRVGRRRSRLGLLLGTLLVGAIAGGLAVASNPAGLRNPLAAGWPRLSLPAPGPAATPTVLPTPLPTPQVQVSPAVATSLDIAGIYRNAAPGVVNVEAFKAGGSAGAGSGFVLDQQGHILTTNHVVESADRLLVQFSDGSETPARALGRDPAGDLAIVQVALPLDRLAPLDLGDSDTVQPGDSVVLIGNPLGRGQTVTAGLVSAVDRTGPGASGRPIRGLIQTDAPFSAGDAGGPLLNGRGQVVGAATVGRASTTGPGLALPINAVRSLLPRLRAGETIRRAYLGISGRDLTPALAQALTLSAQSGVLVTELASGGPAALAGLRASLDPQSGIGGDIIVALDGQEVRRLDDLTRLINLKRPSDRVTLLVRRGPTQLSLPVTLGDWPG